MHFLGLRSNQTAASGRISAPEIPIPKEVVSHPLKRAATLEGLIAEDSVPTSMVPESRAMESEAYDFDNGSFEHSNGTTSESHAESSHVDVDESEGWIAIPYKELPADWGDAPDISSFQSLNRSFVFPGEQVNMLVCYSPLKQEMEIITPFKVAEVMSKNGIGRSPKMQNDGSNVDGVDINLNSPRKSQIDPQNEVSAGESLLRKEDQKRQTDILLQSFNNSHFFVRIAESDEQLWSKRRATLDSSEGVGSESTSSAKTPALSAIVDKGNIQSSVTGGLARNAIKCQSLPNGDIVVLLQVYVGVELLNNPVLEILQFEKHEEKAKTPVTGSYNILNNGRDPCGELLRWLLPLENTIPPPSRPISPPQLSSSAAASIRSTSIKPNPSSSPGTQIFSFSNFRSYSMSSLPQATTPTPTPPAIVPSPRPNFVPNDQDQFSFQKSETVKKNQNEELLSFRGVALEPERFSVRCGLEGIYTPGKRWRKKIEIVRPVDIRSSAADCNTDDLICVQIKNVSPAHVPDIVVYVDAITLVYEEASKGGAPLCFPIACIEAGDEHSLPNLELRRGEEHSFILKPASSLCKSSTSASENGNKRSSLAGGSAASSWRHYSYSDPKHTGSATDQYAILVSCRCNYTASRLFFKQPTTWRPRISRDLMISVASQMSRQTVGSDGSIAQLPVQVLTLQASNLRSEDLTLTVLAPASFTSPPSVLSLSSSPSSPTSQFFGSSRLTARVNSEISVTSGSSQTSASVDHVQRSEHDFSAADVLPSSDIGCTHLWLQSRVPLGCVPAHSTATIKLEVLPLTDGIITLDSLRIGVKEKGTWTTYVPECSLKINATSSVATEVI